MRAVLAETRGGLSCGIGLLAPDVFLLVGFLANVGGLLLVDPDLDVLPADEPLALGFGIKEKSDIDFLVGKADINRIY